MKEKKKSKSNWKLIVFVAVAAGACIAYFIWGMQNSMEMVIDIAFYRDSVDTLLDADEDYVKTDEETALIDELREEFYDMELEGENVTVESDAVLSGTLYNQDSDVTVILLHGYNGSSEDMEIYVPYYIEQGYNVLLTDLRFHGSSEGEITTFGWLEKDDLTLWIDYVYSCLGDQSIIIHGFGVGAVTALLTAADRDDIALVVADTAYTTAYTLAQKQMSRHFSLGICVPILNMLTKNELDIDLSSISAVEAVGSMSVPVLFVYAGDDEFMDTQMTQDLYENCASECSLYVAEGARYGMAYASDPESYQKAIEDILGR